jgi:hypothetical protein
MNSARLLTIAIYVGKIEYHGAIYTGKPPSIAEPAIWHEVNSSGDSYLLIDLTGLIKNRLFRGTAYLDQNVPGRSRDQARTGPFQDLSGQAMNAS